MKSKAVASILRHVASKVPSLSEGGDTPSTTTTASAPTPAPAAVEKEGKRAANKKARQNAEDNEGGDHDVVGGPGTNEEEKLEQLYEQIAWPLGKKYGHPYDAFKISLTYVSTKKLSTSFLTYITNKKKKPLIQRFHNRLLITPNTSAPYNPKHTHLNHRTASDSSTNQTSSGYRVDVLYAGGDRCHQEGFEGWRTAVE